MHYLAQELSILSSLRIFGSAILLFPRHELQPATLSQDAILQQPHSTMIEEHEDHAAILPSIISLTLLYLYEYE